MTMVEIGSSRHGNLQKHTNTNRLQAALIQRFHEKITQMIVRTGVEKVLDAGCGEGFLLDHLRQQGLDLDYTGSDLSSEAISWSRQNLIADFQANVADVHRLPYADNSFPLVICLEVLEHLPDSSVGLRELARVSSGYVLVSVPHEPYFRGANFLRGKHVARWGNDPEHIHNYSGRAFRHMVASVVNIQWHGYSFPWQIALATKRA
jgi:2-polyprenyl-3-methyl-5-hydroxy-6-metoxy-1,4-benzoquinol methylase